MNRAILNGTFILILACTTFINAWAQTTPPVAYFIYPPSRSAFLEGATINIRVNVTDPNGSGPAGTINKVEFYVGGIKIADAVNVLDDDGNPTQNWQATWTNVPAGNYQIVAKAFDSDGEITTTDIYYSANDVVFHPVGFVSNKKYYVKAGANAANNGLLPTTPFNTIQKAAEIVNPGDTVFVMGGLTYKNDPIDNGKPVLDIKRTGTEGHYIVFINYKGQTPHILFDSWSGIAIKNGGNYVEVNGFKIQGNNSAIDPTDALNQPGSCVGPDPYGVVQAKYNGACFSITGRASESAAHTHHHRIINNEVFDGGLGGIVFLQTDYSYVENNRVYDNAWYTIYGGSGISLLTSWNYDNNPGYRCIIKNNTVYGNKLLVPWAQVCKISDGNGIIIDTNKNNDVEPKLDFGKYTGGTLIANNLSFNNGGAGILAFQCVNVDIINNTSYHNSISANPEGELGASFSDDCTVMNNIIVPLTGEKSTDTYLNTNVKYDYNCIFNTTQRVGSGPNDIYLDPQFINESIDPTVANFQLKPTSPLIDKGTSVKAPTLDFLGNARPSGAGFEIGAHEFIPDTTPPSKPGNLSSPSQSTTSINLKWDASTDNVGLAGYDIYNGATKVGSTNSTTIVFTVTSLTANASYTFTVIAKDISGNSSTASNALTISTLATPDITPPSAPLNLNSPSQSTTSINLSWTASTDNIGVTGYDIYQSTTLVGSTNGTTTVFVVSGLTANTSYTFTVKAKDLSGNSSTASNALTISTLATPDVTPPSAPLSLSSPSQSTTSINLSWTASTDNVGVVGYDVFSGSSLIGSTNNTTTTFVAGSLVKNTSYTFTVKAKDGSGNSSVASNALTISTLNEEDAQAPSAPTNLTSSTQTSSSITLSWTASTDNVGVTEYYIYNGDVLVDISTNTSFTITGLNPNSTYVITVQAKDGSGNASPISTTLSVKTMIGEVILKPRKLFSISKDIYWIIEGIENCNTCSVLIFTRSGTKVFETLDYTSTQWNGLYNSERLMEGGYSFVIRDKGKTIKTGTITIIK